MGIKFHILMHPERLLLCYTVLIITLGKCSVETKNHRYSKSFDIDENLLRRRCELICYRKTLDKCLVQNCMKDITKLSKPGGCPHSVSSPFDEACLKDCRQPVDYDCPGTEKCCKQPCGWSCQEPLGLRDDRNLPPIPLNITITERRKKGKMCGISWQMPLNHSQRYPVIFIVEARCFIGSVFSQHKFGDWQWYDFHKIAEVKTLTTYMKTTLANLKLKTGRWYQFRVAAVNEYGFKGYSAYSKEFKLSDQNHISAPKRPKPPKNFSITRVRLLPNATAYARATWSAPKSELPIEKYRVSWALHLKAENDSLLLDDVYVKEPIRYYEFWNLAVNSLYYVQVQAISSIGKKRLKSDPENLMLNTTFPPNSLINNDWNSLVFINTTEYGTASKSYVENGFKSHPDIVVKFIANKKFGMLVRVLWNELYRGSLLELCTGSTDCETKEYGAVKPKRDHIDFGKLKFNTQYTVRLVDPDAMEDKDSILKVKTFTTPTCDGWIKKFPNLSIIC